MAIQDSFSLSQAKDSQAYAYKCWYNYNYGGNTMAISSSDMGEITQTWNSELQNWQATALDDENAYEIEDDDFSTAKANGRSQAEEKTNFDGGTNTAGTCIDAGMSLGGAAVAGYGIVSGGGLQGIAATVSKTVNGVTSSSGTVSASGYIAAGIAIATAAKYWIERPNKEQKEACDALKPEMDMAQCALSEAQGDMENMDAELIELSELAQEYNETAGDEIEENKTEFDMYRESYDALMEKVQSGEQLTEDEKALLEELIPIMQELGVTITETQEGTTEEVAALYEEMEGYQDGFDSAAETVGEVQGLTDYAESFDKTTQTLCYVETGAQGLNSATGLTVGARLVTTAGLNIGQYILGGAAIAAGVSSALASKEQVKYAGEVGDEIDMREATQDFNTVTNDIYDERIGDYEGYMGTVEDLELEMPDDLETPEEAPEVPTGDDGEEGAAPGATTFGIPTTDDKDEKPEKKEPEK